MTCDFGAWMGHFAITNVLEIVLSLKKRFGISHQSRLSFIKALSKLGGFFLRQEILLDVGVS